MKNYKLPDNYKGGVLYPLEDKSEYIFGGVSGIVHEVRNTTRDWRPFEPTGELQRHIFFDDMGCASHSGENDIEMQFNLLIKSSLIRPEDLDWLKNNGYFDENGKINFDDRWIVVLSGTKPGVGNYLAAIWDTARIVGMIPQGSMPFRDDMSQSDYYDVNYFGPGFPGKKLSSDDLKKLAEKWNKKAYDLGQEFLKRFYVQYERITDLSDNSLKKALEHAPVHIGTPVCPGWNDGGVVKYCDLNANHATVLTYVGNIKADFDSYEPYSKELSRTYKIDFAYKGVLSPVTSVDGKKKSNFQFNKNLRFGDYNNDVVELAKRLIEENCWPDTGFNPPSPHFGLEVARGLRIFQRVNGITNWWEDLIYRGKYFGPETRLFMNGTNRNY